MPQGARVVHNETRTTRHHARRTPSATSRAASHLPSARQTFAARARSPSRHLSPRAWPPRAFALRAFASQKKAVVGTWAAGGVGLTSGVRQCRGVPSAREEHGDTRPADLSATDSGTRAFFFFFLPALNDSPPRRTPSPSTPSLRPARLGLTSLRPTRPSPREKAFVRRGCRSNRIRQSRLWAIPDAGLQQLSCTAHEYISRCRFRVRRRFLGRVPASSPGMKMSAPTYWPQNTTYHDPLLQPMPISYSDPAVEGTHIGVEGRLGQLEHHRGEHRRHPGRLGAHAPDGEVFVQGEEHRRQDHRRHNACAERAQCPSRPCGCRGPPAPPRCCSLPAARTC